MKKVSYSIRKHIRRTRALQRMSVTAKKKMPKQSIASRNKEYLTLVHRVAEGSKIHNQ